MDMGSSERTVGTFNYSSENDSNFRTPGSGDWLPSSPVTTMGYQDKASWNEAIVVFDVVNIFLLVATVWILLCMIIYGTKTRKWTKRAGDSSLNSGKIYTCCVIATAMTLPRLILTEALYRVPHFNDKQCEDVGDVAKAAFAVSTLSTYMFLWMKQRLIYNHPYVKDRLGKCANVINYGFVVLLFVIFAAVLSLYTIPKSYVSGPYGCIYSSEASGSYKTARGTILAISWSILEISVLILSIYPAIQVRNKTREEMGLESRSNQGGCCSNVMFMDSFVGSSPIQMSIKRAAICSVIIVITDLTAVILDVTVVSLTSPLSVGQSLYDISTLVNVFCMLGTFTFAGRVLTLLCPSLPFWTECRRSEKSHETSASRTETAEGAMSTTL